MAVKDINAKGGVLGKQALARRRRRCLRPEAGGRSVANQLANDEVVFVDGHYCSGASIPASAVYAENGILQISPASTNPAFTDDAAKKGWINVFRVCGRDDSRAASPAPISRRISRASRSRSSTTNPPTAKAWPTRPARP